MQGYAIYALETGSLAWPFVWPKGAHLYVCACLLYLLGYCIINWALTWELVRKTQLEADQIAGRHIQQTLQPEAFGKLPGYELEAFYKPFRELGCDYFDVIELPDNTFLFAFADVSGKGMPAALLAANIQALVRTIADDTADPVSLARKINKHLSRYTLPNRFATGVFIVLSCDSGELTYVNAGHNPPIVSCSGSTTFLGATGIPLGLFKDAEYKAD